MLMDDSQARRSAPTASFSRAAATYRQHAHVQRVIADWVAEWLPANRTGRALEIGAGPGVFTERLLPWTGELVATDISPAMCAAGRAALPTVTWKTMAAETPLPGPWNWMLSSSMLQWVADPARVFAAWAAELAPGGRILGGLFIDGSLPELRALVPASPFRWRTVDEWRAAIADADQCDSCHKVQSSLRLVRSEVREHVHAYPSALEFWRTLHGIGAAPERRLGTAELRNTLREYDTRYATGAGVRATWMLYRFEAERVT
jgi:malonyl-CoA O-methyltransferase